MKETNWNTSQENAGNCNRGTKINNWILTLDQELEIKLSCLREILVLTTKRNANSQDANRAKLLLKSALIIGVDPRHPGWSLRVSSYATTQDKTAIMSGNGHGCGSVAPEWSDDLSAQLRVVALVPVLNRVILTPPSH